MMYGILSRTVTLITNGAVGSIMGCTTNHLLRPDVGNHNGVTAHV